MFNKKAKRSNQSINAGSMADIAFLLLIFFLVTTTITEDKGIFVKLPPWEEEPITLPINEKNVLTVFVNANNQLLVEGDFSSVDQLREITKNFIANPMNDPQKPDSPKKAVVSIINDRGTSYATYLSVYNEIKGAYNELWEAAAKKNYGKSYDKLTTADQKKIREDIPLVISEAEPVEYE